MTVKPLEATLFRAPQEGRSLKPDGHSGLHPNRWACLRLECLPCLDFRHPAVPGHARWALWGQLDARGLARVRRLGDEVEDGNARDIAPDRRGRLAGGYGLNEEGNRLRRGQKGPVVCLGASGGAGCRQSGSSYAQPAYKPHTRTLMDIP
jgi:hypothetical protein